ncbi:MAG: DNA-binding response regulator [Firmicutes bacterium HGW-Firmicutes-14]|jgi:DNA-binding NarL/FixJ family response regulator|nr:MAG: DNA-binding response regulator [Firmicutes bacterium HGW-Firmicutes-14]
MSPKVKLVLVDDYEVQILGLKTLFQYYSNIEVVGEACSGEDAIKLSRELNPDVVVMDIRMSGLSGIEACREIKQNNPNIKVIMLTSHADDEAVFASLAAGADGYVLKQIGSNDLIEAVEKVGQGQVLLDPVVTKRVVEKLKKAILKERIDVPESINRLTDQEKKVLVLMAEGKTNRQIAGELFLAEKTVRNYVSNILQKLNFDKRSQAIAFGIKYNLGGD